MKPLNSVKIVEDFWTAVWKARNPAAIDDFVVDDFVITTAASTSGLGDIIHDLFVHYDHDEQPEGVTTAAE